MRYICLDKIIMVTRQQFFIQPQKAWQERAERLWKGRSDVMALGSQDFGHCWFQCGLLLPRVRTCTIAASCQRLITVCTATIILQRLHLDACSKLAFCVFSAILRTAPSIIRLYEFKWVEELIRETTEQGDFKTIRVESVRTILSFSEPLGYFFKATPN